MDIYGLRIAGMASGVRRSDSRSQHDDQRSSVASTPLRSQASEDAREGIVPQDVPEDGSTGMPIFLI